MRKINISTNISEVFKIMSNSLEHENVNWIVITSCALALQGLDINPIDIDIITDESGLLKINSIFNEYKISLSKKSPSEIFESTMSKFCINNCLVEVMSNFKIKSLLDNKWYDMSNLLKYPKMINIAGLKIPVLPLLKLIEVYKLMGRDKDIIKIEKIEEYLKKIN